MRTMRHGADGLLESEATSGSERLFERFLGGDCLGRTDGGNGILLG